MSLTKTAFLPEWLQDTPPVHIQASDSWASGLASILHGRNNLLSIWPKRGYHGMSFTFRMLNQHYFVCNSPDTVRRVFLDQHDNYDRKSPQMRHALEPLLGDGLFVSDGELWQQRRTYCAPAFEVELLPDFAAIMTSSTQELADRWSKLPPNTELDMLNEMAKLTAQIIGRTVFGDDTSEEEAAQVVQGFSEYQQSIEQISFADSFGLPFLRGLGNPIRRWRTWRSGRKVHEVIDRIIERHSASLGEKKFTLLSMLLGGGNAETSA